MILIESTPASQLLQFMQQDRQRLGGAGRRARCGRGPVTLEDMFEELAGEFLQHGARLAAETGTVLEVVEVSGRAVRRVRDPRVAACCDAPLPAEPRA